MNERIRELARQSGGIDMTNHVAGGVTCWIGTGTPEFLEKFAKLIRADEREACAKVCEEVAANKTYHTGYLQEAADECAAAIRKREKA